MMSATRHGAVGLLRRTSALLLVLGLAAGCGRQAALQEGPEVDDSQATQRAEELVEGVLDAVAPGRDRAPSPGSGELGPPCDPDGAVTRSRFVGASVPLEDGDDAASLARTAAEWFSGEGLEIVETRTEPPQQGVHARDAAGGTYSLRILDGSGRIAAGANTPCLPEAELAPAGTGSEADAEELAAFLAETADAIGQGAPSGEVPTDCPGGTAVQRSLDLDDEGQAAAAYGRLVDHLGGVGQPVEGTNPDGTRFVTVERGDTVVAGIHVPGSASLILSAERGCEQE
jgi:hypothetical protein